MIVSSQGIFAERFGAYMLVPEVFIVVALVILARWLWKNRDVVAQVTLIPSESDMVREAMRASMMDPKDFQTSLVSARRNVGVAEAVLNYIRMHMNLWGDGRVVIGTAKDALLMKWVFENEYVPKSDIAKAVHERLCEIGRIVYEWHIAAPLLRDPDHSASPEALGYAILHGAVSAEEAGKIRFDHGETAEEYSKAAEKLHESVMRQLGAGNAYFSIPKLSSEDCCCCECSH